MPPLRPRMGWEGMKACVLYSTVILPPVVVVVVAVTPGDEKERAPRKTPSPPPSPFIRPPAERNGTPRHQPTGQASQPHYGAA